jgi:hypothetical protein
MEGYFYTYRKFLDSDLWLDEPFTKGQAWIDLIGLATHDHKYFFVRGIKVDLERGQVGWSEPKLALRWKWSRTKLKNFLKVLEKEQQITVHRDNVNQIITLINYDMYQSKEQQSGQQKNSRKTAEEQQKDVNNNGKNNINKKEVISSLEIIKERIYKAEFESFENWLKGKGSNLGRMRDQLTYEEFETLILKYGMDAVSEMFKTMNNKVDLTKKYVSVYSTASSWLKNNINKPMINGNLYKPESKESRNVNNIANAVNELLNKSQNESIGSEY